MTDPVDAALHTRFADLAGPLPDANFPAVRDRARVIAEAERKNRLGWRPGMRFFVIAVMALVALAIGAAAVAQRVIGPSPALTAGVTALRSLPPAQDIPQPAQQFAREQAAYVGLSPDEAIARVRLLNKVPEPGLYAFEGREHAVCMVVVGRVGACLRDLGSGDPGVLWALNGGIPPQGPSLAGVVADNVKSLTLVASGQRSEVSITHNSFYVEIPTRDVTSSPVLEVEYQSGEHRRIDL